MMTRTFRLTAIFFSLCFTSSLHPVFTQLRTYDQSRQKYEFVNGQWFDGKTFRRQTFYSVNGVLTKKKPSGNISSIDLGGQFVIPPFAEAHNHNLGSAMYLNSEFTKQMIGRYLDAGVFYVKIPGNPIENSSIMRRDFVNRPNSVDVTYANAILTSGDGHPIGMTIDSFKEAKLPAPKVEEFEGKSIFIIDSEQDIVNKWPQIIASKPDFIKTVLVHSQNFTKRRETPSLFGYNGLNPALLPRIVKEAHKSGLRVSTHVNSAADFTVAVRAGVDEINHLPGISFARGTTATDYLLTPEIAKLAAKQRTIVVTTTQIATQFAKGEELAKVQDVQRKNLLLLKQSGVRLAIGSDNYMGTSVDEAMYLKGLNVLDNADLIKMWTVTGPQTIFPGRKIAQLREGYEASFLVLPGNPLENFDYVKDVRMRYKQGVAITLSK